MQKTPLVFDVAVFSNAGGGDTLVPSVFILHNYYINHFFWVGICY